MKRRKSSRPLVRVAGPAKRHLAGTFASGFAVGCSAYSQSMFAVIVVAAVAALLEMCAILRPVLLVFVEHWQWREDQRLTRSAAKPAPIRP